MKKIYIIPSGIDKDTVISFINESSDRFKYILNTAFELYSSEGFALYNDGDKWTHSSRSFINIHMGRYSRNGFEILFYSGKVYIGGL